MAGHLLQDIDRVVRRGDRQVFYPAAVNAGHVIVGIQISVKTHLRSTGGHFYDVSAGGQDIQIAVNRPQTDAGQLDPDPLVDLVCSGMAFGPSHFFQNDLALSRRSLVEP